VWKGAHNRPKDNGGLPVVHRFHPAAWGFEKVAAPVKNNTPPECNEIINGRLPDAGMGF
jgi:hypothetical protein